MQFIDDIAERGKFVVLLVAVHSVIDYYKMYIMLREVNLRVHAYLQIITANRSR